MPKATDLGQWVTLRSHENAPHVRGHCGQTTPRPELGGAEPGLGVAPGADLHLSAAGDVSDGQHQGPSCEPSTVIAPRKQRADAQRTREGTPGGVPVTGGGVKGLHKGNQVLGGGTGKGRSQDSSGSPHPWGENLGWGQVGAWRWHRWDLGNRGGVGALLGISQGGAMEN